MIDHPWSRRGFLKAAGYAAAATAVADPSNLFAASTTFNRILIPLDAHPAVKSAAAILAEKLALDPSAISAGDGLPTANEIIFAVAGANAAQTRLLGALKILHDGYAVIPHSGGLLVLGARPRSLLFAAGEPHHWASPAATATWLRNPSFALRCCMDSHFDQPHRDRDHGSVAQRVALLGANFFTTSMPASPTFRDTLPEVHALLSAADQARLASEAADCDAANAKLAQQFHDADVAVYALLPYGNNFGRWSPVLYAAALQAFPSAKGTPHPRSWEKAALCPSDPATWRIFEAYVRECADQSHADGISATFWDQYGIYCDDDRCRADGLDQFKNELHAAITHYTAAIAPTGKKLHLRTWSSGCPHWLGQEYVHAPGYGQFSESHYDLWSRVIKETPADILIQTKASQSDCEPDPRFTTLLGKCKPHTEIVEYQVTGQTIGRQYFPASIVNYLAATLKRSLPLVGPAGGAEIGPGGTAQSNYDPYSDIVNNVNIYAWRELTWNVNADLDKVWLDWAAPIYGKQAAPHVIDALRRSEEAVVRTFSPLGFGSDTNSSFAGNIQRRETLLRYTNRNFLPEYAKFLAPTKENIALVAKEKAACQQNIQAMADALAAAKPYLAKAHADELDTRFDWLREFSICHTTLDISLWRYSYLRALSNDLTTDPAQMQPLADAHDLVAQHSEQLFRFDPALKFSCYDVPLGDLRIKPSLGSPIPLMKEIYAKSRAAVEDSTGPEGVPPSARRG